ncbi:T9SS type A sorting domain-containing protein [Flavobacterium sp.]|uniref:T9SS type A sorting domain-containing protein n=1 Tax=Flavobacterium sp. TaxID=239 RepID=UPI002639CB6B|nr:T9SS type A sorting domain-containing protein [Flavobacterium sp.]
MKKNLLFILFLIVSSVQAQDYWTEKPTGQPAAAIGVTSISYVDANTVWLNNNNGSTTSTIEIRRYSKSLDGGLTWTTAPIDLGASSADLQISCIDAVSADVAYASVFGSNGATGGIWKTTDGGATWTRQSTASFNSPESFPNLVHFFNENEGVCMGDPDVNGFEIYTTSNGGANWVRKTGLPATLGANEYGYSNQFDAYGNSIWIGTGFGRILRSTDKGLTWTAYQTPLDDFGGQGNGTQSGDFAFEDENNGLLISSDYQCFKTTDGGATWTNVPYTPNVPGEIPAVGIIRGQRIANIPGLPNTYVCVGTDVINDDIQTARGSSYTTDNGVTWIDINDNPDTNYVDGTTIKFYSQEVGLAGGFSTSPTVGGVFKWNNEPLLAIKNYLKEHPFNAYIAQNTLEVIGADITNVTLFDVSGKEVSNTNFASVKNTSMNVSNLNTGVYLVKVTNNAGATATIKVIKN